MIDSTIIIRTAHLVLRETPRARDYLLGVGFYYADRSYAPATWHGDPTQAIHGSFKAVAADGLACRRLATKHSASGLR